MWIKWTTAVYGKIVTRFAGRCTRLFHEGWILVAYSHECPYGTKFIFVAAQLLQIRGKVDRLQIISGAFDARGYLLHPHSILILAFQGLRYAHIGRLNQFLESQKWIGGTGDEARKRKLRIREFVRNNGKQRPPCCLFHVHLIRTQLATSTAVVIHIY